jgi:hypothetical protein
MHLEGLAVVPPRLAVHARSGVPLQREVRRQVTAEEAKDVDPPDLAVPSWDTDFSAAKLFDPTYDRNPLNPVSR